MGGLHRHEHLVVFPCKKGDFHPACGMRLMIATSAHLSDHVITRADMQTLPDRTIRRRLCGNTSAT